MKIIFQDKDLVVCIKPAGAVSTDEPGGMPERIRKEIGEDLEVRAVHRLDSVVAGLMVYALSREAASGLSRQIEDGSFVKEYLAALEGHPEKESGELQDYLRRSQKDRKTYAVKKGGRDAQEAALLYRTCSDTKELSLVRVKLITGRTHQIRAQFSSRKLPLYGDRKYGASHTDEKIALWSCHLHFTHPLTGEEMDFSALPPERIPWTLFEGFTEPYALEDVVTEFKRSVDFGDCPYAYACDGCAYQGMDYGRQLEKKQKLAAKHLRKFAEAEPILPAEEIFHYRYKADAVLAAGKDGRMISGIYSRSAKRVVRISQCRINHPKADEIIHTLRSLMVKYGIQAYDEKKKTGWLRHVVVRIARTNGAVMLILVGSNGELKDRKALIRELLTLHPEIYTILLNVNPAGNAVLGKEERVLSGPGYLEDKIGENTFRIGSRSFFPVNPVQGEKSIQTALAFAELTGNERVLDVFCGTGILSIMASVKAKRVLGVDGHADMISEALCNAKISGRENVRLICADPEAYTEALVRSHDSIDVVFMDYGRNRISAGCVDAICSLKPERIVVISGKPETLAADLERMTGSGYQVKKIQPLDLLPFAQYVETVCLLSRNK